MNRIDFLEALGISIIIPSSVIRSATPKADNPPLNTGHIEFNDSRYFFKALDGIAGGLLYFKSSKIVPAICIGDPEIFDRIVTCIGRCGKVDFIGHVEPFKKDVNVRRFKVLYGGFQFTFLSE